MDAKHPKPYSPLATILIAVGIFLSSQLFASILISIFPLLKGWSDEQANTWLESNVWVTFSFIAIVEILTLGILYFFIKRRGASFKTLGINKPRLKHIVYALAGFAVYFVAYIVGILIIEMLLPQLDLDQKQEIGFDTNTRGLSLIPIFVSLVVLVPVTEEIIVRGFLFGGLRTKLPFVSAAVVASAMFAAAHLGEASNGLLWVAAIDTFILSLVLCYLREKTESLWPSIYVHMIKNSLAFIVLFNIIRYFR